MSNEASKLLPICGRAKCITFGEVEKVNYLRHVCVEIVQGNVDIVNPSRNKEIFSATYAKEQVHSETFMNMYMNQLAKERYPESPSAALLDWTFGPVAFASEFADWWLDFDGQLWDSQFVPILHAVKFGARGYHTCPSSTTTTPKQ